MAIDSTLGGDLTKDGRPVDKANLQAALADAAAKSGGNTFTGEQTGIRLKAWEAVVQQSTWSGALTLNLSAGNVVKATRNATCTPAFAGFTDGVKGIFELHLAAGTDAAVTWTAVDAWIGGSEPTLGAAGTDVIMIWSLDGGATVFGAHVGTAS